MCDIYNYADDNTICVHGTTVSDVVSEIELISNVLLNWFETNFLQANPNKFQFILIHTDMLQQSLSRKY